MLDSLLLIAALAAGGTSTFLRVLALTGALRALEMSGIVRSRATRIATSIVTLVIIDQSPLSLYGLLNYLLNLSAGVVGNLSAHALFAKPPTLPAPAPTATKPVERPAPAKKASAPTKTSAPHARLHARVTANNPQPYTYCGLKPNFLNKEYPRLG